MYFARAFGLFGVRFVQFEVMSDFYGWGMGTCALATTCQFPLVRWNT